ncbi:MAG: sulfatase [Bacteroidota bacterium]
MKQSLWFLLLLLCLSGCAPAIQQSAPRPNILLLIADDWSYPHAGVYGDRVVRTPTFDRLAAGGSLFEHAYCASPSCTPSRGAILTGRFPHQLESNGNLWSALPKKFPNYVDLLEASGYWVGFSRKGWAPGDPAVGGYDRNPAGPRFQDFKDFFRKKKPDQPFCFWFGSTDPHRVYRTNSGAESGMNRDDVTVPPIFPVDERVRNDILDYYFEVERFDRDCGEIIRILDEAGQLDNTLVVMTSDNGMPFPRAKANVYDAGSRMPMVIHWPARLSAQHLRDIFVSQTDLAPTFLAAAGLDIPEAMGGRNLLPMLDSPEDAQEDWNHTFIMRERHANVRKGNRSYPVRAVRTADYLYIRNLEPDLYPAGDPEVVMSVGQLGDVDNSITKFLIMDRGPEDSVYRLAFGKRPGEELYDVQADPWQLHNLAEDAEFATTKTVLGAMLDRWMEETEDLRLAGPTIYWDTVAYQVNDSHDNVDVKQRIQAYQMTH